MENSLKHSYLKLDSRNSLTLDGVSNIEEFDGNYITLATDKDNLRIEGEGMKIVSLSKEDGAILVTGKINGIFYSETRQIVSFWKRLFG